MNSLRWQRHLAELQWSWALIGWWNGSGSYCRAKWRLASPIWMSWVEVDPVRLHLCGSNGWRDWVLSRVRVCLFFLAPLITPKLHSWRGSWTSHSTHGSALGSLSPKVKPNFFPPFLSWKHCALRCPTCSFA